MCETPLVSVPEENENISGTLHFMVNEKLFKSWNMSEIKTNPHSESCFEHFLALMFN